MADRSFRGGFLLAIEAIPAEVLEAFCGDPLDCIVSPLGSGNINDTYLVGGNHPFVLQKINGQVFPEPLLVIENFRKITDHLRRKRAETGIALHFAVPVMTRDNRLFTRDEAGAYWRAQSYLPHQGRKLLTGTDQAYRVGEMLARFHCQIGDLDLQGFSEPLPGFHDLPRYLREYDLEESGDGTDADVRFCLSAIDRYRPRAVTLVEAEQAGILSRQPIHGDPKVDNFLFDDEGEVLGLLDLDTVAVGLLHHDLGDCLRSCCNTVGENVGDGSSITFDLQICRALLDGYFSRPGTLLGPKQRTFIFDGLLLICFELGVRFFTDHLRGNCYFKVEQDGDNLLRAVNQFRLADIIAAKEQAIRAMTVSSRISI